MSIICPNCGNTMYHYKTLADGRSSYRCVPRKTKAGAIGLLKTNKNNRRKTVKELISKEQALEAYRRGETVYYDNHNRGRYYATEEEFMAADLDNHFGGDWLYALEFHLLPSDWPPTEEELAQRPGNRGFKRNT